MNSTIIISIVISKDLTSHLKTKNSQTLAGHLLY